MDGKDLEERTSDASSKGLGHGDTLKEAIKDVLSKFKESTFGQTNR